MEEEVAEEQSEGLGEARLPRLSKTSPYRLLNALPLRIAIAWFWQNQLASLGSPFASSRRQPIALKITPVDSPCTPIVSTAIGSNWCASARAAYLRRSKQLCQRPWLAYWGAPQQRYQQTCNPKPNSYHH